ncbi:MAG TPA: SagB/ThcOx family dehydrogenase [Nitrospiraceae bacterium]|jgi:SagB-type dehydrogenase family enzyme|nr:SagB/ThcOx family dehydrogenase [Nitrospiraceae bacterium]
MDVAWEDLGIGSGHDDILWELFHENTKLSRCFSGRSPKEIEKHVEGLQESLSFDGYPIITLPRLLPPMAMSVGKAIQSRTSEREMIPRMVRLKQLATILHHSYGVTRRAGYGDRGLRATPSAGALFPLELFVHARCVHDLAPGLYHYNPTKHHLRHVRKGDCTEEIGNCFTEPAIPRQASLIVFVTALFERTTFKYGDRGYRFVFLEAGHVVQNINIVCSALRLGSLNVGGFFDREIDKFLRLNGLNHSIIYIVVIGSKSKVSSKEPRILGIGG